LKITKRNAGDVNVAPWKAMRVGNGKRQIIFPALTPWRDAGKTLKQL